MKPSLGTGPNKRTKSQASRYGLEPEATNPIQSPRYGLGVLDLGDEQEAGGSWAAESCQR